ncbi:small, acid-soluble spore protein, alpha/beta type [Desulfothermobacter acidiphilus]|uniref:small, acid-soluble spore protein, alpha/beta type n=1 Tax=Desulfothermobacter acidiphilus TaxID=1938353 RepID=UPI003F88ABE7
MARFYTKQKLLPREARVLLRDEVARELGVAEKIENNDWGEVKARDCGRVGGKIGGSIVRVMIKRAEEALSRGEEM